MLLCFRQAGDESANDVGNFSRAAALYNYQLGACRRALCGGKSFVVSPLLPRDTFGVGTGRRWDPGAAGRRIFWHAGEMTQDDWHAHYEGWIRCEARTLQVAVERQRALVRLRPSYLVAMRGTFWRLAFDI